MKVKYSLIIALLVVLFFNGRAQNTKSFQDMIDRAFYYLQVNIDTMKMYTDSAKILSQEDDDLSVKSLLNLSYGHYYLRQNDMDQAELCFLKTESYAKLGADSAMLYQAWMGLGTMHNYKAEHAKALKYFLDGLYYIKHIKKPFQKRLFANANNNVAMIYNNLKNYDRSIFYYKEGLNVAKEMNDTLLLIHIGKGLSKALIKKKRYGEALPLIRSSIVMAEKSRYYLPQLADLYHNLGNVFFEYDSLRSIDSALFYTEKAALIFQNQNNIFMVLVLKAYLADIYLSEGNYKQAKKILEHYKNDFDATDSPKILNDFYKTLSDIEFHLGNIPLAYDYLKNSYQQFEKLSNRMDNEYLYDIVEDYVNQENQLVKDQLERKISMQALQLDAEKWRKRTVMIIAAFAILLVIILGWSLIMVYRKYMAKQMLNNEQLLHLETSHQLVELKKKAAENKLVENKKIVEISNKNIMYNAILVEKLLNSIRDLKPYVNKEGLRLIKSQLLEVSNFSVEENWNLFEQNFAVQYPFYRANFFEEHPTVSLSEFRLSCYILMKLTNAEIAAATLQSPNSLRSAKFRLRQRLKVADNHELYDKLLSYAQRKT